MNLREVVWTYAVRKCRSRMRFWAKEWRKTKDEADLLAAIGERAAAQLADRQLKEVR